MPLSFRGLHAIAGGFPDRLAAPTAYFGAHSAKVSQAHSGGRGSAAGAAQILSPAGPVHRQILQHSDDLVCSGLERLAVGYRGFNNVAHAIF